MVFLSKRSKRLSESCKCSSDTAQNESEQSVWLNNFWGYPSEMNETLRKGALHISLVTL